MALAASAPVDDSGTYTLEPTVAMRWQQLSPRAGASRSLTGMTGVHVHLNLARWVGRTVRIYMLLPGQQPLTLSAEWSGTGRLMPGRLAAGERALVYEGRVGAPVLEDDWRMSFAVDGAQLSRAWTLNFQFEIDDGS